MWFLNRHRTLQESGLLSGFTDWHSHLLPGVDDGVQTPEESLSILSLYERLGVREVWLTPHIMEEMPNSVSQLRERFNGLRACYKGPIVLHLAAEHMLDTLFQERLSTGEVLPLGPAHGHLLVETSYFNPPMGLDSLLESIQAKGYHPVLAHPERYAYLQEEDYRRLKAHHIQFQLNLPSLAGAYGKQVRSRAEHLLKQGLYEWCGNDLHSLRSLEMLLKTPLSRDVLSGIERLVSGT